MVLSTGHETGYPPCNADCNPRSIKRFPSQLGGMCRDPAVKVYVEPWLVASYRYAHSRFNIAGTRDTRDPAYKFQVSPWLATSYCIDRSRLIRRISPIWQNPIVHIPSYPVYSVTYFTCAPNVLRIRRRTAQSYLGLSTCFRVVPWRVLNPRWKLIHRHSENRRIHCTSARAM